MQDSENELLWCPEGDLGWLVEQSIPDLWLNQLSSSTAPRVTVDLKDLVGIDVAGLRFLADLITKVHHQKASKITIVVGNSRLLNMLKLAQLDLLCTLQLNPQQ